MGAGKVLPAGLRRVLRHGGSAAPGNLRFHSEICVSRFFYSIEIINSEKSRKQEIMKEKR